MQGVEAAFHRAEAQRRPGPCRLGDAFELLRSEIAQIEKIADKPSRAFGDDHHVGFGDALQARRQIGRFANDAALLVLARASQVAHDDDAGRDADPGLQCDSAS